jgi:hypothetical protein
VIACGLQDSVIANDMCPCRRVTGRAKVYCKDLVELFIAGLDRSWQVVVFG